MEELIPRIGQLKMSTLVFHNVKSLNANYAYINNINNNLLDADVLLFAEARVSEEDRDGFSLSGFDYAYHSPEKQRLIYSRCTCVV